MAKGTVKWFSNSKGYGFIQTEREPRDIFVHHTSIEADGYRTLNRGEVVEFQLTEGPKGLKAEKVVRTQAEA